MTASNITCILPAASDTFDNSGIGSTVLTLGVFCLVQKVKASNLGLRRNKFHLNRGEHRPRRSAGHAKGDENVSLHGHSPRHQCCVQGQMNWVFGFPGVVIMNKGTVRCDLTSSGKPAHQCLMGCHLSVELVHILGIDNICLHPLLVFLVRDAEAVGHLDTLFVDTAHQSSYHPVVLLTSPLIGIGNLQQHYRVHLHLQVHSGRHILSCRSESSNK